MVDSTGANQLDLRLVRAGPELEAAQALRFDVFYREMGAHPTPEMLARGATVDRYDALADHLVVVDLDRSRSEARPYVVGCYRMLRGVGRGPARWLLYLDRVRPRQRHGLPRRDHGAGPLLRAMPITAAVP